MLNPMTFLQFDAVIKKREQAKKNRRTFLTLLFICLMLSAAVLIATFDYQWHFGNTESKRTSQALDEIGEVVR